jgi:hypothetical protein
MHLTPHTDFTLRSWRPRRVKVRWSKCTEARRKPITGTGLSLAISPLDFSVL